MYGIAAESNLQHTHELLREQDAYFTRIIALNPENNRQQSRYCKYDEQYRAPTGYLIHDIDRQYSTTAKYSYYYCRRHGYYSQSESLGKQKSCRVLKHQHSNHQDNIERFGTNNGAIPREGAGSRPSKREGQWKSANE